MRRKVQAIADHVAEAVRSWPGVECAAIGENADESELSPYLALVVDVYYRDSIPQASDRRAAFGSEGVFESSRNLGKDRFDLQGLPVHVEYKDMSRIERVLRDQDLLLAEAKLSGTYMLYRLAEWKTLFERGDWVASARRDLASLKGAFWSELGEFYCQKMEHCLEDFGQSEWRDDKYFGLVSLAEFLRYAAGALFVANRRFEPAGRYLSARLPELSIIPDSFLGLWDTLLRSAALPSSDDHSRRYEVARRMAASVISLL
jgi:hypothetical protein